MERNRQMQWRICPSFYIFMALLLLSVPLRWLLAMMMAALIHELSHMVAMDCLGVPIRGLEFNIGGASLEAGPMSPATEILCALAGPVGGLLVLPFARWVPGIAVCSFVQSAFNLLPIYPLDGGRFLRCLLRILLPPLWAIRVEQAVLAFAALGMLLLGIRVIAAFQWESIPVLLAVIFLVLAKKKKKPLQC